MLDKTNNYYFKNHATRVFGDFLVKNGSGGGAPVREVSPEYTN